MAKKDCCGSHKALFVLLSVLVRWNVIELAETTGIEKGSVVFSYKKDYSVLMLAVVSRC